MKYVDGFVLVVPKKSLDDYRKMAEDGAKMWMKYGALEYKECIGEDLNPDMGEMKVMTFPELVNLKPDETVVFSFIVYESREHRDEVNARVMEEMNKPEYKDKPMPFEMERMAYGGFEVTVDGKQ